MRRVSGCLALIAIAALLIGCAPAKPPAKPLPNALLLALAVLEKGPDGKPVPQPAQLGILTNDGEAWHYRAISDPDSNVFHKAAAYEPRPGESGVLTAGGTRAILKLWRKGQQPVVIWEKDFGGKFSRMREFEVADLFGDGSAALAVVTHDQGVVATVRPMADGSYQVTEIDHQPDTFVHEVEVGDLNKDGILEVYATPSPPNKLDGTPQPGEVTRYVPATGEGRTVVAELGDRHAKEILVKDVDGDGTDELYVSVEAVSGGRVEIRRFDAGTDPTAGAVIATLDDKMCRFLTAGDVDGDGRLEMVAAAHKSGLWLLRPGADPHAEWTKTLIDANSSGFEHAAILADLDENGIDELYVANDDHAEVDRYQWVDGEPLKDTIYTYPAGLSGFTWNITAAPVGVLP